MLSVEKLLLKGEVGVCHGNYIVDHGKSWDCVIEFLWEPCHCLYTQSKEADKDLGQNIFV